MAFCDTTVGIGASFQTHGTTNEHMDGQTDVEYEIII